MDYFKATHLLISKSFSIAEKSLPDYLLRLKTNNIFFVDFRNCLSCEFETKYISFGVLLELEISQFYGNMRERIISKGHIRISAKYANISAIFSKI